MVVEEVGDESANSEQLFTGRRQKRVATAHTRRGERLTLPSFTAALPSIYPPPADSQASLCPPPCRTDTYDELGHAAVQLRATITGWR